jgi:hypothetical protein
MGEPGLLVTAICTNPWWQMSVNHWWDEEWQGKLNSLEKNLLQCKFSPKIPHELSWDWTKAFTVRSDWLILPALWHTLRYTYLLMLHTSYEEHSKLYYKTPEKVENIVACRPIARKRPCNKQLYNSRYWVMASQTNMFQWQKLNYNNEEQCFLCSPCQDVIRGTSWALHQSCKISRCNLW